MADKDVKMDEKEDLSDSEFSLGSLEAKEAYSASSLPVISVYNLEGKRTGRTLNLPEVCLSPLRSDVVLFIWSQLNKNSRQPYGIEYSRQLRRKTAGYKHCVKSWGTGRAIARVARIAGKGRRSGQGARANICRGGTPYGPPRVWRKWHRKVRPEMEMYALASALAGTCVPALVSARGHRIDQISEVPVVIEDDLQKLERTQKFVGVLEYLKLNDELDRIYDRTRTKGKAKYRNRKLKHRVGPLVVYKEDLGITRACRNVPGVDHVNVKDLNLLQVAPAGQMGRLIIWTESAFNYLNTKFGTVENPPEKTKFRVRRPEMTNADLKRLIYSAEIQSVVKPKEYMEMKKNNVNILFKQEKHKNPLAKATTMARLNPLFEKRYKKQIQAAYSNGKNIKATRFFTQEKIAKKQRLHKLAQNDENEQKLISKNYWKKVFGKAHQKSSARLNAEKEAIATAVAEYERQKTSFDF